MEQFLRDLRYGYRALLRTPGATATAVLALALGIGANSAIFSVVYAVLLRPLPIREEAGVVSIRTYNPKFNIPPINPGYSNMAEWPKQATSFERMAASWAGTAEIEADRQAESAGWWRISADFLPLLGVSPAMGRAFTAEDDRPGAAKVALLDYGFWRRRFGSDPGVAGKAVRIARETYTIAGVMPRGFQIDGKPPAVYTPIAQDPADRKHYLPVTVYGRLKPGIRMAQAQAEMDTISRRLDQRGSGWRAQVLGLRDSMARDVRPSLLVLLGAVSLVLLIACANIASLLLARSGARQREIAIRAALGAGRRRLLGQLLTESVLLALAGGGAGLALAAWAMRLVPLLDNERLPSLLLATRIDFAVLGFTFAVSLATGVLFGIVPALSSVPARVGEALQQGGRTGETGGRRRIWRALAVAETALAVVLMIGATLLIRSFFYLRDTAPGFRVDGLITAPVAPPKGHDTVAFYRQVLEKVRAIPGVSSATLATSLPLDGDYRAMSLPLEGRPYARPQDWPILWHRTVDNDYFRTLGVALRRGRLFTDQDVEGAMKVAIVNESLARRFGPGVDPIGKHIGIPSRPEYYEVVGVVADIRHQDAAKDGLVEIFFPYRQAPPPSMVMAVRVDPRVSRDPLRLAPTLGRTLAAATATGQPPPIRELLQMASDRLAPKRLTGGVIGGFASLALLLAAVGIYGVLSFTVSRRTHEIGVRMALGAESSRVVRSIVGEAFALVGIGIAIGIAGALALSRVLASLLHGVTATDPASFALAACTLLAVGVLASWLPAHRAARVDPIAALRMD